MNLDAKAAIDAQRQWNADRRDEHNHARQTGEHCEKLVVTPLWELYQGTNHSHESFPYTGRWALCPRCLAGPPSAFLARHFPAMIGERPGEEYDVYIHQCFESNTQERRRNDDAPD